MLGGMDVLVFMVGIGEYDVCMCVVICVCFDWLGVQLDESVNVQYFECISYQVSCVWVLVILINEEQVIVDDVVRFIYGSFV